MKHPALRFLAGPALAMALLLAATSAAPAASLQVAPTSVTLKPGENAGALWLSNADDTEKLRAQVRVFRWTQENGEEKLEPTRDLSVSPPIVEVAGGARQLIRVIRTSPPPPHVETTYRVMVDELPDGKQPEGGGLRFLMRYSVPVFVLPSGDAPLQYALDTRLEQTGTGQVLVVSNQGNQHAQIADLTGVDATGARSVLLPGLVGYVLPGQTMRWPLPANAPAGGRLVARINGEQEEQTLAPGHAGR